MVCMYSKNLVYIEFSTLRSCGRPLKVLEVSPTEKRGPRYLLPRTVSGSVQLQDGLSLAVAHPRQIQASALIYSHDRPEQLLVLVPFYS